MQQIAHIFYSMAFLLLGSSGKPIDYREALPELRDFHRRFWTGEVRLADIHAKTVYGRIHWEQLMQNTRQARFHESLRVVSEWHARQ
jgi:hypothetical protein